MSGRTDRARRYWFRHGLVLAGLCFLAIPVWAIAAVSCAGEYRFCFRTELELSQLQQRNSGLWNDIQKIKRDILAARDDAGHALAAASALKGARSALVQIKARPGAPDELDDLLKALDAATQWYQLASIGAAPADDLPVSVGVWRITPGSRDAGGTPERWLTRIGCWEIPADKAPATCPAAFQTGVDIGYQILTVEQAVEAFNSPLRKQNVTVLQQRTAEWKAYLYDTQFQYWWELGFNRWLDNKLRDKSSDKFDNEIGLRKVPTERAILFHPDVGLQYIRDQAKGDQVLAAMTFEWIGFLKWSGYKDDTVTGLWGVSVASTIADQRNAPRIGTGLMFHLGDYALAVTSHGGHIAYTINLKLGDKLSTVNDDWAQKLKSPLDAAASKP